MPTWPESAVTCGKSQKSLLCREHVLIVKFRGGTAFVCLAVAWWGLPEMKNRSYREIDIMFKRLIPARKWKETVIDVNDDE